MTPTIDADRMEAEPFLRNHPKFIGLKPETDEFETAVDPAHGPPKGLTGDVYPWVPHRLHLPEDIAQEVDTLQAFSIVVIKVDPPMDAAPAGPFHEAMLQILENASSPFRGAHWKDQLYIAIGPDSGTPEATRRAAQIKQELARNRPETISIGLTAFPVLGFSALECIANGGKALDHATFYGPDSTVEFDAVSLNVSGDLLYQAGDLDGAIAEYRCARQLDPNNANVLNSLGVCMARKNDMVSARKLFELAWKNDASDAMGIYNLAILHILNGESQSALPLLKQAMGLNDGCFDIPFQLGRLLYQQKSHHDAVGCLQRAVALKEDCAMAHYYLGQSLARTAQPKAAIQALRRAIKLNPNDASAMSALGALYTVCNENSDICETFFQQSIALKPHNGLFHHRLGRFYQKHNQLEKALKAYESAHALGYDSAELMEQVQERINNQSDGDVRCA